MALPDANGRASQRYKIPCGAVLTVRDRDSVAAGPVVALWHPHTPPMMTEVAGKVAFSGMEGGLSVRRQTDHLTGLTHISVMDPDDRPAGGRDMRPMVTLLDND